MIPIVSTTVGFIQSMVMMSFAVMYYIYIRGNSPFISFEDKADGVNLHYRLEESKTGVFIVLTIMAAIGSKTLTQSGLCAWLYGVGMLFLLGFMLKNLFAGIKNTNEPLTTSAITLAQTEKEMAERAKDEDVKLPPVQDNPKFDRNKKNKQIPQAN